MPERPESAESAARAKAPPVDNRRNYYRVLHVQPEAPTEVIKASWRTLMMRLKAHPDLGGSHAEAALLNEAWAVLGDAERRAAYDRLLRRRALPSVRTEQSGFRPMGPGAMAKGSHAAAARPSAGTGQAPRTAQAPRPPAPPPSPPSAKSPGPSPAASPTQRAGAAERAAAGPPPADASDSAVGDQPHGGSPHARAPMPMPGTALVSPAPPAQHSLSSACALCGQACAAHPAPGDRCLRCHAPLRPMPAPGSPGHELLGRRGAMRRAKDEVACLRIGWPSPELSVRWRDLSLTGLSLFTPRAIAPGQRILVVDPVLETVAEVVDCRPQGRLFTVHARLLTALLRQSTGVFVSAQA